MFSVMQINAPVLQLVQWCRCLFLLSRNGLASRLWAPESAQEHLGELLPYAVDLGEACVPQPAQVVFRCRHDDVGGQQAGDVGEHRRIAGGSPRLWMARAETNELRQRPEECRVGVGIELCAGARALALTTGPLHAALAGFL